MFFGPSGSYPGSQVILGQHSLEIPKSPRRRCWRPITQEIDGVKEKRVLNSTASQSQALRWLVENGPKELELLFRAIIYHPSAPILITDDDGNSRDASVGVGKLLGLSREKIIGRPIDDFAQPGFKPQISQLWRALREQDQQEGTLQLVGPDASPRDVEYTAKGNVLPVRHVLVLRDKTAPAETEHASTGRIPSWVQDYALYLLDSEARIAAWYSGAARIYGYQPGEAIGQHVSFLYPDEDTLQLKLQQEFKRASAEGHMGTEGWQARKDASRFWANAITMVLKDESGELQGFARVVRDFSERHEKDEKLRHSGLRTRATPPHSSIAGVVSSEFD